MGMIGSAKMQLGSLYPKQLFPEVTCESNIMV
jgi:hypothetical protein